MIDAFSAPMTRAQERQDNRDKVSILLHRPRQSGEHDLNEDKCRRETTSRAQALDDKSMIERLTTRLVSAEFWHRGTLTILVGLVALTTFVLVVSVPLGFKAQLVFATGCFILAMRVRRNKNRFATLFLIVLSLLASGRYMFWRITWTTYWQDSSDAFWGIVLLTAEIYSTITLVLGYFQTAWPFSRKPLPLPADQNAWPSVDLFIPTYNEPLGIVKPTIYAALSLDYPKEKLKIHVLDDGCRSDFKAFCKGVGVHWRTRENNRHAKAGNINEALKSTCGEYVAIFDCDHIPVRSFLQTSLGWFLHDDRLSMLQTPHHFFSPDPFERNLATFDSVPSETELFYGVLQRDNDLWNATYFCGSCAVIRRSMLEEIGGIAVETVTEDAHTALKLHRRGYSSAYISIPQAAGLATETLREHIAQRIRWARGMIQIFRLDNPLTGKGLTIGQRLCYVNAMMHFLYGIPRLVFLTAPLCYLFFGVHIIDASAEEIAVFVVPHILHASLTNSRIQGKFRYSFWDQVYETVFSPYIIIPTLLALINPRLGAFNVTPKGGKIENDHLDWSISRPYLLLLLVNFAGIIFGCINIISGSLTNSEVQSNILNIAWTCYNILIVGTAIATTVEKRQVRASTRVKATIPASLRLSSGRTVLVELTDYSIGGVGVRLPEHINIPLRERMMLCISHAHGEHMFPVSAISAIEGHLGLQFDPLNYELEMELVLATFSRADAWIDRSKQHAVDKPLCNFFRVGHIGLRGILMVIKYGQKDSKKLIRKFLQKILQ